MPATLAHTVGNRRGYVMILICYDGSADAKTAKAGPAINRDCVRAERWADRDGQGVGSGVIYRSDGIILTNHHVVANAGRIELALADGSRVPGHVTATDPDTDLGVRLMSAWTWSRSGAKRNALDGLSARRSPDVGAHPTARLWRTG
ncbi:MAG: trypsin-like peptidase domain-containing protein [Solirubrobacteraceae bacterium]